MVNGKREYNQILLISSADTLATLAFFASKKIAPKNVIIDDEFLLNGLFHIVNLPMVYEIDDCKMKKINNPLLWK